MQLRYNPIGSGGGVVQFLRGATHFGGSDTPLSQDDVEFSRRTCPGSRAIGLPMVGGPVAIGYNVEGVDSLVLDAPTLARIFDSRITMWNDPEIRRLNPGARLPETGISAVHRSDNSGTTQNFNAYLADAAPEQWPYEKVKAWQARGGHAAPGSDGVVSTVSGQNGSIGYFELSFAKAEGLPTVKLDTGAAEPVTVSARSASAGIAAARVADGGQDLTLGPRHRPPPRARPGRPRTGRRRGGGPEARAPPPLHRRPWPYEARSPAPGARARRAPPRPRGRARPPGPAARGGRGALAPRRRGGRGGRYRAPGGAPRAPACTAPRRG
ncbi:hypothetical protein SMICM17S_03281 [Streptomyces microflavus]